MVSKTIVGQPTVGSNPTPSATVMSRNIVGAPNPQRVRGVCCRDGVLRLQPEHSRENRRLRTIKEPTEPVDRPEVNGKRSGLRLFAFYVVVTLVPIAVLGLVITRSIRSDLEQQGLDQ